MALLAASLGTPMLHPARAATASPESAVKVAFIFNFLKFVQWSPGAFANTTEAVSVCVTGGSDLDGPLGQLQSRLVQDRTIQIRRVVPGDSQGRCHVMYYGTQPVSAADLGQIHTVTIGDAPNFAEIGGIVNFFRDGERLRFEINVEAARQANVQFSADMLRLARIIDKGRAQ